MVAGLTKVLMYGVVFFRFKIVMIGWWWGLIVMYKKKLLSFEFGGSWDFGHFPFLLCVFEIGALRVVW